MKRIVLSISLLLGINFISAAQNIFAPFLQEIEQNSTELQTIDAQIQAEAMQNKTGLTPENLVFNVDYGWMDNLIDPSKSNGAVKFKLGQSFDFPGVYVSKYKLSKLKNNALALEYNFKRTRLLLRAQEACIALVYYNASVNMVTKRFETAMRLAEYLKEKRKQGAASQIEYNRAYVNALNYKQDMQDALREREKVLAELEKFNGGKPINFDIAEFSEIVLPLDFEAWYKGVVTVSPFIKYFDYLITVAESDVKLKKMSWTPSFAVNYQTDFAVNDPNFNSNDVSVDVVLPLWKRTNTVKQAKLQHFAAQVNLEDQKLVHYNEFKLLYLKAVDLSSNAADYKKLIDNDMMNEELLKKAYLSGELSMVDYLVDLDFYYVAYDKYNEIMRKLNMAYAELNAYKL